MTKNEYSPACIERLHRCLFANQLYIDYSPKTSSSHEILTPGIKKNGPTPRKEKTRYRIMSRVGNAVGTREWDSGVGLGRSRTDSSKGMMLALSKEAVASMVAPRPPKTFCTLVNTMIPEDETTRVPSGCNEGLIPLPVIGIEGLSEVHDLHNAPPISSTISELQRQWIDPAQDPVAFAAPMYYWSPYSVLWRNLKCQFSRRTSKIQKVLFDYTKRRPGIEPGIDLESNQAIDDLAVQPLLHYQRINAAHGNVIQSGIQSVSDEQSGIQFLANTVRTAGIEDVKSRASTLLHATSYNQAYESVSSEHRPDSRHRKFKKPLVKIWSSESEKATQGGNIERRCDSKGIPDQRNDELGNSADDTPEGWVTQDIRHKDIFEQENDAGFVQGGEPISKEALVSEAVGASAKSPLHSGVTVSTVTLPEARASKIPVRKKAGTRVRSVSEMGTSIEFKSLRMVVREAASIAATGARASRLAIAATASTWTGAANVEVERPRVKKTARALNEGIGPKNIVVEELVRKRRLEGRKTTGREKEKEPRKLNAVL
ncbi:hypothetical protein C8J56DRAFT_886758 [Mycena floridula]|nr:hypothetical protein C8J56DRAFT_886758 [Mycena floridula]